MRYEVTVGARAVRVDAAPAGRFLVDGEAVPAETIETVPGLQWLVRIGGRTVEVTVLTRDPLRLLVDGVEVAASAIDERALAAGRAVPRRVGGQRELRAPMPGLVKAVLVAEGDLVERGAPLLTLEAMKMENELRAPARGRVVRIAAGPGTKVEGGAVLVVLAELE